MDDYDIPVDWYIRTWDDIIARIDLNDPTTGKLLDEMEIEDVLTCSMQPDGPFRVQEPITHVDIWNLRKFGHMGHLPLHAVNAIYKFAPAYPENRQLAAALNTKKLFDDVIAASEGTLFWAKNENMRRISPSEILSREMGCSEKLANAVSRLFNDDMAGRPECRWAHRFNWITEEGPCGSIKPAKR